MGILTATYTQQAKCLIKLAYSNPFRPGRKAHEQGLLGSAFIPGSPVWSYRADMVTDNPNVLALGELSHQLVEAARLRLTKGVRPDNEEEVSLYDQAVSYLLFHKYRDRLRDLVLNADGSKPRPVPFYDEFLGDVEYYAGRYELKCELTNRPDHVFALCFQIRRAFHYIYSNIIGGSMASANLRARIWESIFTHDMPRYRRGLYERMGDQPTLITGPTGTGKELVAQAVGLSRYVPFDARSRTFAVNHARCLRALNLSALSPTLIESEVFGHRRGAFTGALEDKAGWLETCGPHDTVFLDEIGDLDPGLQVKLLRVLQTRVFQRLGDTQNCSFHGKIIAATNHDLQALMLAGNFRTDFYYRLCADQLVTVSLAEQLRQAPEELVHYVRFIADKLVGDAEGPQLTEEVMAWISINLGQNYAWPGNVRELEQCVRNIMIHNQYQPPASDQSVDRQLRDALRTGELTADDLTRWYCTHIYRLTGSYQETARLLQLDRRTVKAKLDDAIADRFTI